MKTADPCPSRDIDAWDGSAFGGTKIALMCDDRVVAYLRDDKPEIPFPGLWDLPGGGREGSENPIACALREVEEEFGLSLSEESVVKVRRYQPGSPNGLSTWFCVAGISADQIELIRFGSEGQRWLLMAVEEFLEHPRAVSHLKNRLRETLSEPI